MKFNIKYTIAALSVFMFTAGCDDKLDAIDVIGYTGVPVAIETVTSEPLPGQIQLRWEVPAGDFSYLKTVSYTHLRAHETDSYLVCRLLLEKKEERRASVSYTNLQEQEPDPDV